VKPRTVQIGDRTVKLPRKIKGAVVKNYVAGIQQRKQCRLTGKSKAKK
jgi:hypothetical protein